MRDRVASASSNTPMAAPCFSTTDRDACRHRCRCICCACWERVIERLGSNELIPLDLCVVAATKVDLREGRQSRRVPRRPLLPPERGDDRHPTVAA